MKKAQNRLDEKKYFLTGKIYIKARFKLMSPLLIGSGESEHSDIDVIRDEPFMGTPHSVIPATSVIGVFRHLFDKTLDENLQTLKDENAADFEKQAATNFLKAYYEFWGFSETDARPILEPDWFLKRENRWDVNQSALQMSDVLLKNYPIIQRDSVRIDPRTGTAADQAKFDYEIVEPSEDSPIEIVLEVNLRNERSDYIDYFKAFVGYFLQAIENGHIRFGAKTNKGFGVLELLPGSIQVAHLQFINTSHIRQWLTGDITYSTQFGEDAKKQTWNCAALIGNISLDLIPNIFQIRADFRIKNSMLVRSYSANPQEPDVSHIQRGDDYVLPGTSIMGALRHRAWKIINTMVDEQKLNKEKAFYKLFGFAKEDYPPMPEDLKNEYEQKAAKGRVMVEESLIKGRGISFVDMVQTRIKIDRFTGGTIAGALLQEKALWQTNDESIIQLDIKIRDYQPWEPALFMFILKDLVTGDLPIGGEKSIGRGVLIGNKAKVSWTGEEADEIDLEFDEDGFVKEKDQDKLEAFSKFMKKWHNVLNETKKVEGEKNE